MRYEDILQMEGRVRVDDDEEVEKEGRGGEGRNLSAERMRVRQSQIRIPIRRIIRGTRIRIIRRTIAAGAADGLTVRHGERGVDVEVRVDHGEIPRGAFAAPFGAEVGIAEFAEDDAGGDSGVGADETCGIVEI